MTKRKKITLIALGGLAALLIFTATVLPVLIKNKTVELLREATGREVRIERFSLNPLTLTASVQGFAVEEKGGGPFLSIGALRVSVSPSSLYRRALVLSGVSIESPSLRIIRTGANRFNFSEIAERQKKGEKPESTGILPFIIKSFRLTGGSLDIDDRLVAGGRKHSIHNLEIALPWLSSIPAEADREAVPRISALVNGAPLVVTAKLKPFRKDMEGSAHIALQKLSLPELVAYLPQAPPVDLTSGKLTIDAELLYRQTIDRSPELIVTGLARLDAFDLKMQEGQPLLKLPSLEVKMSRLEPFAGLFDIEAVNIAGLELFLSRNRQGGWMFADLLKPNPPERATAPGKTGTMPDKSVPPSFSIASLALQNGRIHFHDELPPGGFKAAVEEIALTLKNVGNRPGQAPGQYGLSLLIDRQSRLASQGSFTLAEPTARAAVQLTGLQLQKGWPYLAEYLTAPLQGVVDLSGEIAFSGKNGLTAEKGSLAVKDFSVRYGNREGLDLAHLALTGASFSQKANRLEIDQLRLSRGNVLLSLEPGGKLSVQSLLLPQTKNKAREAAAASAGQSAPVKQAAAGPLNYRLKRFEIDRFNIAVADQTHPKKPRFTLRNTTLSVTDLSGPAPKPAKFRFASLFGKETPLQADGAFELSPFRYRGDLRVGRLPIRDFEAYYPGNLNFLILGGLLDATVQMDVALKDGAVAGSFRGKAGLSSFHAVDAAEEEDLLKWQRLQFEGIDGDINPLRLAIGEVSLNEVYSRIIVREDGTLNLQNLIRQEETDDGTEKPRAGVLPVVEPPAAPESTAGQGRKEPPDIRIGNVTILDGTIAFTDKHLPNNFETTFYNLGGRISGLSSQASLLADVDLRGNLESRSPMKITGKINPLRDDLFVDLKLSFTDIDLSPMSPYAETYLGYILKQGKLFLDLKYHIENKKLLSENKIMIDQFTFGDQVKSDRATSLPVKLGLALLKDRHGEIHLDVPVTGQIDDPRFNIWGIVIQVLKNLLVKAVTSPFSLLSSLFGGGDDLSVVGFSPGESLLQPDEERKLESLAKGLSERPALKISLSAYVDRAKDAEGYRNELLNRKLKREKVLVLAREKQAAPEENAVEIPLSAEEYATYLKAIYTKEKFPKPRNALGQEIKLPDAEMLKLILAHTRVEKEELENLAHERAAAVLRFLIDRGKIPAERIFQKTDDILKPPAKIGTPPGRVELNAITP